MPARLVLAPPAAGKTAYCLQRLSTFAGKNAPGRAWVVLPDRQQVSYFRRRLARQGGALGVQLSTFEQLYRQILAAAGQSIPVIGDTARYRLIQAVVQAQQADGHLSHYAPIQALPGFITSLRDRFAEIKAARVFPEALQEYTQAGPPSQRELAGLYLAYQVFLQQLAWADREGFAWLAVESLESDPAIFSDYQLILLDGFDDLATTQVALLQQLAKRVPWVEITLTGSPGPLRRAQARFERTREKLVVALGPETIYLETPPHLTPALAGLEHALFETQPAPGFHADGIHLLETRSPVEEASEAIRWIKALCMRHGLPPADTAIFTPNPDLHLPHLHSAAQLAGIPLNITIPSPLSTNPAVRALIDLLELPRLDFPRQLTLDALRAPFFDLQPWNISRGDAGILEHLSVETRLTGSQEQWRAVFADLAARPTDQNTELMNTLQEEAEWQAPRLPSGQQLARLADGMTAFFFERLVANHQDTLDAWIVWLEDLLEAISFPELCDPEPMAALRDVCRALLLSEQAAPAGTLDYPQFLAEFFSAVEGAGYQATAHSQSSGVLVAPLIEARGLRFTAVAILGLSEGLFPQVERADPFLPEALRAALGLEPRLGRFQASIFYQAALRSDRFLLLTRPYLAEGGEAWEPSPYWQAVQAIYPETERRLRPENWRDPVQATSPAEALFWAVRQSATLPSEAGWEIRADHVQRASAILQSRLARRPHGPYEGFPADLQPELAELFPPSYGWSASRFEAYTACPHHFWAQYLLVLEPQPSLEPGLEPAQLGSLLHSLLESAYARAVDRDDPHSVITSLRALAPAALAAAPHTYGFRPGPLWAAECEFWLQKLEENVFALAELEPGWSPEVFEAHFGLQGQPALELRTPAGTLRLRGLIDRVDRQGERLRVIDYKTGSSHQGPQDLLDGRRLQLPIYALAAEALGMGRVVEGFYWQLRQAKPGTLRLSRFTAADLPEGLPGAAEIAVDHISRAFEGIQAAEFPPIPPSGGCPAYCPAAGWCWRYQASRW